MRIATWNVNSLRARLDKVWWWLERASPDVLLLQETKLADDDAPIAMFEERGYKFAHHGEGRWNGVAIASRKPVSDIVTNFGAPLSVSKDSDHAPLGEARMISAVYEGVRVISIYAPNGRELNTEFYEAKLGWYERLTTWLEENYKPTEPLVLAGDFNIAPADIDVWDPKACNGGTHVSERERSAYERLLDWGLTDIYRQQHREGERYSWYDYRAGMFHKNFGMRIDHVLVSEPLATRAIWSEIDREARKGKPTPSDHAPVVVDLDEAGRTFDAGWKGAEARIASRRK